jgi:hypothetical protein
VSKYLIVGGDSFTSDFLRWTNGLGVPSHPVDNMGYLTHKTWPKYVADHLGLELINTAKAGSGNMGIYTRIQDAVLDVGPDNVGYVIAAWSKCERLDLETDRYSRRSGENKYTRSWTNRIVDPTADVYWYIHRSLRSFWQLQFLCEQYNIPYHQFQMISLFKDYLNMFDKNEHDGNAFRTEPLRADVIATIKEFDYFDRIQNFRGWPIFDELGGFTMEERVIRNKNSSTDPTLVLNAGDTNKRDVHPNSVGHKIIAETVIEDL